MTDKSFPLQHPDTHAPASAWTEDQKLRVAVCYSNPFRWRTRRELANDLRRHMAASPNVELHFIELAYGDRPFEVTGEHKNDIQVRTRHELFHKENLLNIAISRFPRDWQYGAIIDADFHFTRHDWALEAVHQLQHYDFVQLFSSYSNLSGETRGEGHRPTSTMNSFAYNWHANGLRLPPGSVGYGHRGVGATGGAWAFRRAAFDTVGGLLDKCILGSADWFMAFALAEEDPRDKDLNRYSKDYRNYLDSWARRAARLTRNFGYVDCHALHHFHGPMQRRGYSTRDAILCEQQFEPTHDTFYDWQGVLQLTPDKPRLRDAIRRYFVSRSEDLTQ